jgi:dCTP deaminase
MLLSDNDLIKCLDEGSLRLDPFDQALVQPSSIDVRLDKQFRVFNNHLHTHIDPRQDQPDLTTLVEVEEGQPFILHPGEFVLASTLEVVTLDQAIAARLEGKSSLGRLGLVTHSTAGFVDPGFSGQVTLELSNAAQLPIRLWPGMKIGQLGVFRLSSPSTAPYGDPQYGSRYQHQRGPTPSRYAGMPVDSGEDLYTRVARARACRWGYDRTMSAEALETFVGHMAGNADLRATIDTVRRQLGVEL